VIVVDNGSRRRLSRNNLQAVPVEVRIIDMPDPRPGPLQAGFFGRITESYAFSVPRGPFERIGGFDERFTSPGGGLANLEIFRRFDCRARALVCLLPEGLAKIYRIAKN
jgi:hypothetical protein